MKLQGKLVLNAMISLVASLVLVGYIIFQLLSINSQNNNLVPAMLDVQQLDGELVQTGQALSNFSFSMSASNKALVTDQLQKIQTTLDALSNGMLQTAEEQKLLAAAKTKFQKLNDESTTAMNNMNSAEAKRQSIRVEGIQNDVYMLDQLSKAGYSEYTKDLTNSIDLTWQIALGGAILLLIAVGWFNTHTARQLAKRSHVLNDAAQRIADGDLTVELAPTKGKDELDELNASFRQMISNLRSIVGSIGHAGNRVDEMAQDIDRSNDRMQEMVNQVAISVEELAIGSQKVAEDLSMTVSVVDEMQHKFQANLETTAESAIYSEGAIQSIEHGSSQMKEQLQLVSSNRAAMAEVAQTVRALETNASEIASMTMLVSEIASQTNLLSLNASIEAARAGEAGQGFAVVAGEVKKLADQSVTAASQIFKAVDSITSAVSQVQASVSQSLTLFQRQEQATASTDASFAEISEQVKQIAGQVNKLAQDMQTSHELSNQVQQAIENISAITEQSAAGSQEITASTVEQQQAFRQSGEKVKMLRQIREEMQHELDRFHMDASTVSAAADDTAGSASSSASTVPTAAPQA
ncbi:methyl-accepting chemotaxis protein [Paenibacillus wulumuqiensis]|uniref:methyl-accepting chemotaxis protein n=1 Tax=Paenibacillus wulumuqiensis TaxID=1567107 RepID=UPI000619F405|nr:methyl-accepting chemotaxis protein [Paenibacillus wulumuqiensis]